MVATVQKIPLKGLKITYNVMISNVSLMYPTRVVHRDPARGLIVSRASELHW